MDDAGLSADGVTPPDVVWVRTTPANRSSI